MKKKTVVLAVFLLSFSFIIFAQESERRVALVIGNADYEISPLQNPVNDARDMAAILKDLGFEVNTVINGTRREMFTAIQDFGRKLNQYNVGLFYYAGHGIQFEGTNFIVPIDANIQKDVDIQFETINIGRVLAEMESAGNAVNIVILDACRNNPYVSRFRSINRGLSVVEAPAGSLIVYATAPGDVAAEGRGRNGVFTGALLKHIKTPGIEVREMFTNVRRDVLAATGNEQTPWDSSSLTGSFYFAGAGGGVAAKVEAERIPTITVEKSYGSVVIEVRTAGTLYLDGTQQVRIPAGGTVRISDLEEGSYSLEMRYEDGQREERSVIVEKDRTIQVAFSYVEWPPVPEGFVLVEAGTFQMGSTDVSSDERPVHRVTISRSFYMSQYEVTQTQWRDVMGTNPSRFKGDALPVEMVSWYDAVEYCNRLSRKEGITPCYSGSGEDITCDFSANGYRLPTEAEWEYAARGGNKSRSYTFYGSNSIGEVAWYNDNSGGKTHPVGQKRPNELGLYDMSGNVYELCWDWYGSYSSSSQTDPRGPSGGSRRVARGGSWRIDALTLRAALSVFCPPPSGGGFGLGFRPLRTAEVKGTATTAGPLPGSLDTSFGIEGKVTTDIMIDEDKGYAVEVQSDGKILVAGFSAHGIASSFTIARYTSIGSLDTSFGTTGIVTTLLGQYPSYYPIYYLTMAIQSDGKIVVAFYATNGTSAELKLARYAATGSLDSSFGTEGIVTTPMMGDEWSRYLDIAIQSDGKILVAGGSSNGSGGDFALMRYTTIGSPDDSFGTAGKVVTSVGHGNDWAYAVAVQADGKIVVAGSSYNGANSDFAVARYTSTGSLDTSFGAGGIVTTPVGGSNDYGTSIAIQSDNRILVAGSSYNGANSDFVVARYTSTGSLDTSFGTGGIVTTDVANFWNCAPDIAIQSDNRILVSGSYYNGTDYDFALARYTSSGNLDTSFGSSGIVTTAVGDSSAYGYGVAIQADGKILVAGGSGSTYGPTSFALVRYWP